MEKIRVGDVIKIEYAGSIIRVKVLGMHGNALLIRGVGFFSVYLPFYRKKIINRHDYYFFNFNLLNPEIATR